MSHASRRSSWASPPQRRAWMMVCGQVEARRDGSGSLSAVPSEQCPLGAPFFSTSQLYKWPGSPLRIQGRVQISICPDSLYSSGRQQGPHSAPCHFPVLSVYVPMDTNRPIWQSCSFWELLGSACGLCGLPCLVA